MALVGVVGSSLHEDSQPKSPWPTVSSHFAQLLGDRELTACILAVNF